MTETNRFAEESRQSWVAQRRITHSAGSFFFRYDTVMLMVALVLLPAAAWSSVNQNPGAGDSDLSLPAVSFGIKSGLSLSQHYGTEDKYAEYTVSSHWRPGFGGGVFLYLPVTDRFGLQQEVMFFQRGSSQDIGVEILDIPTVLDVTYDADYIEIPVLTRFTWFRNRGMSLYSLAGTAMSLKVHDRYKLEGEIDDGIEVVPLYADDDMSEVSMFDFSFVYGTGFEFPLLGQTFLLEYRFVIGWSKLDMPTYAYVPFGEDEELLIENEPVPLRNQNHLILLGVCF
jgi:hypothetical protein